MALFSNYNCSLTYFHSPPVMERWKWIITRHNTTTRTCQTLYYLSCTALSLWTIFPSVTLLLNWPWTHDCNFMIVHMNLFVRKYKKVLELWVQWAFVHFSTMSSILTGMKSLYCPYLLKFMRKRLSLFLLFSLYSFDHKEIYLALQWILMN